MIVGEKQINLSENAIKVLEKRYLKRDSEGNCIEKPEDMTGESLLKRN